MLRPRPLPDVNNYTMIFKPNATVAIAAAITGPS
jgi:hypothetical protein